MKVVVGIEDEIFGNAIIDFIGTQRWEQDSEFVLLHAIEYRVVCDNYMDFCCIAAQEAAEAEKQSMQKLLMDLDLRLLKAVPSAKTEQKIVYGNAREKLLEEAEHVKADLIIVGSHGRRGFTRFMLGSVSSAVLAHATSSVLIVKLPQRAKQKEHTLKKTPAAGIIL